MHALPPVLTQNGYRVFGSVRRQEDAQRLFRELGSGLTPILFDVTDAAAVGKGVSQVGDAPARRLPTRVLDRMTARRLGLLQGRSGRTA
jgi:hypothetical protein